MTLTTAPPGPQPDQFRPTPRSPAMSGSPPSSPGDPAAGPPVTDPPVQVVPTLLGALAVLAATAAIPPMIRGDGWFWPTVEIVAVIWLVGVGGRLARLPAVAVMAIQLAAVCIALTALFTTGGIGGVLPNGTVLAEARDLVTGAWDQIRGSVPPAPSTVELSFLIAVTVGATALIVDILIGVCRAPALVALPLLCVYSVPASIDPDLLPWLAFVGPAMLYALLLVASGLQGRRVGTGAGAARVVTGLALAALTTVVAVLVASTVTGVGTTGRLPRSGVNSSSTGVGLSPFASLRGNLLRGESVEMLRVTGLPEPDYLRIVGLQRWDGDEWSVDSLASGQLPSGAPTGESVQVQVTPSAYRDRFLPIYEGTSLITGLDDGWSFDAALASVHRDEAVTPQPYELAVAVGEPTADELRADSVTPGGLLTDTGGLNPEVVAITEQLTATQPTAFDKAEALRTYFTDPAGPFEYSLDVPVGDSGDALVDFLRLKQGYCAQYASAMALMLREAGVPARVAIGFTQGTRAEDGSFVITSNDAHAWVEVLFNTAGWVRFDPTPLGSGTGGQQGFAPPTAETTAAPSATGTALQPGQQLEETGTEPGGGAAVPTDEGSSAATATQTGPDVGPTIWVVIIVLLLAGAAGATPGLIRSGRRRRRLAAGTAGGPGAAAAVWREIEDIAVDHGLGIDPAESARVTANRMARAAHLASAERERLRDVVVAAEREWYGRGADTEPAEAPPAPASAEHDPLGGVEQDGSGGVAGSAVVAADRRNLLTRPGPAATPSPGDPATRSGPAPTPSPRDLSLAARELAVALDRAAPLAPLERLIPRSVRPPSWRR